MIRSSRYKPDEKRLDVVFVNGRRYSYRDVPAGLAEDFRTAFSKGEFFNAHIRDHFPFSRERPRGPPL